MGQDQSPYVSRAGLKLRAALEAFNLDVTGFTCADLGCSTGGFVDCLLQHGAKHVYAVDTAYGELAWKLRQDPRVTVQERSNALHLKPLATCDLVTVDLGWTPQRLAIPAASQWLTGNPAGQIITLIKPHYEATPDAFAAGRKGKLDDAQALKTTELALQNLTDMGFTASQPIPSPIRGGKGKNLEYLALVRPT